MGHDAPVEEHLAAVHELWSTYRERGAAEAIPLLDPDVEFVAHDGRAYRGHEGVRRFFAEFEERGERFMASPYTFEPHDARPARDRPPADRVGRRGCAATTCSSSTASATGGSRASPRYASREEALADITARASA